VNVAEAKARLSGLIEAALKGEEVVISRRNKPVVRLAVIDAPKQGRRLGWAAGMVTIADDFDEIPEDFREYVTPAPRRKARK
jgi:prevent-host-death family protein